MSVSIITQQDLYEFKVGLLEDIRTLLETHYGAGTKKYLKSREVMEFLGISAGTLQTLKNNGTLEYTRIGGVIYYSYEAIVKQLEANQSGNP